MGYNQKFVKVERVIEKVKRDFPGSYKLEMDDVIEWIGEAISLVGAYSAYQTKETDGNKSRGHIPPVVVSNYRAALPCDLYKLNVIDVITEYDESNYKVVSQQASTASSELFLPNSSREVLSPNTSSYRVRNGYIYFDDMETGLLNISYESFITDERGYPMVPDDDRYVKALASYITERLGFRMMLTQTLSERMYDRLLQTWMFNVNQAYTGSLLMGIDDAESFRNSWTRMVGDSSARSTDYAFENKRQEFNTHNN